MPRPDYAFRPLAAADLALLQRWLAAPYVARWGTPERQLALRAADRNEPTIDQFGVTLSAEPFAYLQCYRAAAAEGPAGSEPAAPCGIDQLTAVPDMVGRGHGSALIRSFVDGLFAGGCPRVLTDPDPANERAIRADRKAGFASERLLETSEGPRLLLTRDSDRNT